MKILVVEPHLDDAFFSLTETAITWVEDGHEVDLLTVFGGVPPIGDEHHLKYVALWQEYEAAIERGPFEHLHAMNLLDDAARLDQVMWDNTIEDLNYHRARSMADVVVFPTGIHHPDHHIVRSLARSFGDGFNDTLGWWFYDELPYYVLYPEQAFMSEESNFAALHNREGCRGHLDEKKRICRLFASQMGDSVERCIWAPERVWRPA